ncbi:MAG: DUF4116 domain-containing protein [Parachlamydiaceae bacterium]|nr:DUF4116 domain-containing protein [Parachlamydiaceae bacterium]
MKILNPSPQETATIRYSGEAKIIQLGKSERIAELCKLAFYSLLTIITIGNWKPAKDLWLLSLNRVWTNKRIVTSLIKDTTSTIKSGNENIQSNDPPSLPFNPQAGVSFFNIPKDPLSVVSKFLDTKTRFELLKTCKMGQKTLTRRTEIEVQPLLFKINQIGLLLESISAGHSELDEIRKLTSSRFISNVGFDFQEREKLVYSQIHSILEFIFIAPLIEENDHSEADRQIYKIKNIKEIALLMMKVDAENFEYASEELKDDEEVFLTALESNIRDRSITKSPLRFASQRLKMNKNILLKAVQVDRGAFECMPQDLNEDDKYEISFAAVSHNSQALLYVPKNIKNFRQLVLIAVSKDGSTLGFSSEDMRNDKEVVLTAIRNYPLTIGIASDDLKNDEEILIEAIKLDIMCYRYASDNLKNNKAFVIRALMRKYNIESSVTISDQELIFQALQNDKEPHNNLKAIYEFRQNPVFGELWKRVRKDKQICLRGMKEYSDMFEYLSQQLRGDYEVALEASINARRQFKFVEPNLLNNKSFVLACIKYDYLGLENVSETLRNDEDVILEAMKDHYRALEYASDALKTNRKFVLKAVLLNGLGMEFLPAFRNDPEIVMTAVKSKGLAITFADESFLFKKEYVLEAIKAKSRAKKFAQNFNDDKEVMSALVTKDGSYLRYASDRLKHDVDIVTEAVKNDWSAFEFVHHDFIRYKEVAIMALKQNLQVIALISKAIINDPKYRDMMEVYSRLNELEEDKKIINSIVRPPQKKVDK